MTLLEALKTRWIAWVWNYTPACAEMSRLMSQRLDRPPTLEVRVKMWLHFLVCVWCERYAKHLRFLRRAAPLLSEQVDALSFGGLSAEAKHRMKMRLHSMPAGGETR